METGVILGTFEYCYCISIYYDFAESSDGWTNLSSYILNYIADYDLHM